MMKRSLILLAALTVCVAGCRAPVQWPGAMRPRHLSLSLQMTTVTGQYTYFELDGRQLSYGGGRDAAMQYAQLVGKLTDDQLDQVWQIITSHRLFEAPNAKATESTAARFKLALRGGGDQRALLAFDNDPPGVKALHDLLFGFQVSRRY